MDLGIPDIGDAVEVGMGASAQVFKARQLKLDRDVAVKVLSTTDADFVRRFHREARTLGRLSRHDGIVTLYEFGETTSGQPYLILELCEGSLLDRIRSDGQIEPFEASKVLQEVAATVAVAHDADVVHRDLKPANILINHAGKHLITDFGISTVLGSTSGETSSVGFTAGYAAPETFEGTQTSGREADVYALGATFFHMLSGQPPFAKVEGDQNLLALIKRIADEPVADLRAEGVPGEICTILEQAVAKDPAQRPTAAEFATQLGGFVPTAEGPAVADNTPPSAGATRSVAGGLAADLVDPPPAAGSPAPETATPANVAAPQPAATSAETAAPDHSPSRASAASGALAAEASPRSFVRPEDRVSSGRRLPVETFAARRGTLLRVAVPALILAALVFGAFQVFRTESSPTESAQPDAPRGETAAGSGTDDDATADDAIGDDGEPNSNDPAGPSTDDADEADEAENDSATQDGAESDSGATSSETPNTTTGNDGGSGSGATERSTGDTASTTSPTSQRPTATTPTVSISQTAPKPPAELEIPSISGPGTVTCWEGNETYTAVTNGVAVTSWNWNTGGLGLQTPFNSGPSARLSFDLDPGNYTITVRGNNSASASKTITVVAGPGCTSQAPNPIIAGPAVVECNTSHTYSVAAPNGVPLTSYSWSASGPSVSSPSGSSTTIGFSLAPGTYSIRATVNGSFPTNRTITVTEAAGGCG